MKAPIERNKTTEGYDLNRLKQAFERLLEVDKTGKWICLSGKHWEWFDYKRAFNRLLEIDKTGEWLFRAGLSKLESDRGKNGWKWFDFEIAFDRILEVDKDGEWIYNAATVWPYDKKLNQSRAFEKLLKVDKTGKWLCEAGCDWISFDFDRAINRLLEVDDGTHEYIFLAERQWKEFDYEKVVRYLIRQHKISRLLGEMKNWKINEEKVIDMIASALIDLGDKRYIIKCFHRLLDDEILDENCKAKVVERAAETDYVDDKILEAIKKLILKNNQVIKNPSKEVVANVFDLIL